MKVEDVAKMDVKDRFIYWIKERHQIHLKRQAGMDAPWTDDEVLQSNFFTNPYRENDRVTIWFRENIRDPLKDEDDVLFATVAFRWFNKPDPTGEILLDPRSNQGTVNGLCLLRQWDEEQATELIREANNGGKQPVFTGAYMIKAGNGPPGCKIPNVCAAITNVWNKRHWLVEVAQDSGTMEALHKELVKFPHLGGFMSYEVVCDLRYTSIFGPDGPSDVETFSNLGPGAARGLQRMNGIPINVPKSGMKDARPKVDNWLEQFRELLAFTRKKLPRMPRFELREIEHSLCEFDKYERIRLGEGRSKRKYNARG